MFNFYNLFTNQILQLQNTSDVFTHKPFDEVEFPELTAP